MWPLLEQYLTTTYLIGTHDLWSVLLNSDVSSATFFFQWHNTFTNTYIGIVWATSIQVIPFLTCLYQNFTSTILKNIFHATAQYIHTYMCMHIFLRYCHISHTFSNMSISKLYVHHIDKIWECQKCTIAHVEEVVQTGKEEVSQTETCFDLNAIQEIALSLGSHQVSTD